MVGGLGIAAVRRSSRTREATNALASHLLLAMATPSRLSGTASVPSLPPHTLGYSAERLYLSYVPSIFDTTRSVLLGRQLRISAHNLAPVVCRHIP